MLRNKSVKKFISIFLIHVLFFNTMIPLAQASGIDSFSKEFPTVYKYSSNTYNVAKNKSENDLEELKTEAIEKKIQETIPEKSKQKISLAIPGGPGQQERSRPVGDDISGLVDEFTGDLTYSIPLMDVEGFPLTLTYDPNITMDQEASWVGLGWNLNLGSISRNMRGIPDDFNGDKVVREFKKLEDKTLGMNPGFSIHTGFSQSLGNGLGLNFGLGVRFVNKGSYENTMRGLGMVKSISGNTSVQLTYYGAMVGVGFEKGIMFDSQKGKFVNTTLSGILYSKSLGSYSFGRTEVLNSRYGSKSVTTFSSLSKTTNLSKLSLLGGAEIFLNMRNTNTNTRGGHRTFNYQAFVPKYIFPEKGHNVFNGHETSVTILSVLTFGRDFNAYGLLSYYAVDNLAYPAYGFSNMSKGQKVDGAMMDFNRSGGQAIKPEMKTLPFSTPTYDVFTCSAPSFNSNFRNYRYDAYEVHDPAVENLTESEGESSGFNINIGSPLTFTTNNSNGSGFTSSGSNGALRSEKFKAIRNPETTDCKEYYIQTIGEFSPQDNTLLENYGGSEAHSLSVNTGYSEGNDQTKFTYGDQLVSREFDVINNPDENYHLKKLYNATYYNEIRIKELKNDQLKNYKLNCASLLMEQPHGNEYLSISSMGLETSALKKDHHIGGMEVTNQLGTRFVFGMPSYSYLESEVSFSAQLSHEDDGEEDDDHAAYNRTGMIQYSPNDDYGTNDKGREHLFDKTTMPAYSKEFLLTEMYSSDYLDRTGDGPSQDDMGNYYKINYSNFYGEANPFKWRFPMCGNGSSNAPLEQKNRLAILSRNIVSDEWDDMASYSYGEKDLSYAVSVESKNFIAFFCFENREDQFSMLNEDGGLDLTKPGKLLKAIYLFNKNDISSTSSLSKALKIIEFDYDYSLCKHYVGNRYTYLSGKEEASGKLTLKAIYESTGKSSENKTVPIEFVYGSNRDFAFNSSDRWGNYKPNNMALPNHDFPYAEQDEATANANIQAWKLVKVKSAAGSELEFKYEADAYSHVQNERAMKMYNILGMSNQATFSDFTTGSNNVTVNEVLNHTGVSASYRNPSVSLEEDTYDVVYFALDKPYTGTFSDANIQFNQEYMLKEDGSRLKEVYFSMYSQLGNIPSSDRFENVQSSAEIIDAGVVGLQPPFRVGYVKLKRMEIANMADDRHVEALNKLLEFAGNNDMLFSFVSAMLGLDLTVFSEQVNPLQAANWQFARVYVPCILYGVFNYSSPDAPTSCFYYDNGNNSNIFGANFYKKLNKRGYGIHFDNSRSMMRLFDPDNHKFGGNSRIKQVIVRDGWNELTNESVSVYRYGYKYEPNEKVNGVSSYEPVYGNNENALIYLDAYTSDMKLLPDEVSYQVEPFADMIFPSPVVGYKTVEKSLNSTVGSNGKTANTYYTAYDFPTLTLKTLITKDDQLGKNAEKIDKTFYESLRMSQGFYVETNDFHGKPYQFKTYDDIGNPLSSVSFQYFDNHKKDVRFLDEKGKTIRSTTPRDVDIYADSWNTYVKGEDLSFSSSSTRGIGLLKVIWEDDFGISYFKTRLSVSGFTFTKQVHTSAIVSSIVEEKFGVRKQTDFVGFDAYSGTPLITAENNEFDEKIYSVSYPAHWKYKSMGNKVINQNAIFSEGSISGNNNNITYNTTNGASLQTGDELSIVSPEGQFRAWVTKTDGNTARLVDANGERITGISWGAARIRVVKSGNKNDLSNFMMSYTGLSNPVTASGLNNPGNVINISAMTFKENYNLPCFNTDDLTDPDLADYEGRQFYPGNKINPFLKGVKGNFRPYALYEFQADRTNFSNSDQIRLNGRIEGSIVPFYSYSNANDEWESLFDNGTSLGKWREFEKVYQYDEFGKPIQTDNQLDISSTVLFGMNQHLKLLPKASAIYAKSNEIGFDGFEDYEFYTQNAHTYLNHGFSLKNDGSGGDEITSDQKHSGRYSLRINDGAVFSFYTNEADAAETEHLNSLGEYITRECDCINAFAPEKGNWYMLSVWVKEDTRSYSYANVQAKIKYYNQSGVQIASSIPFTPSGPVIDGWQKMVHLYQVPELAHKLTFEFYTGDNSPFYIDDFRTHPELAQMTTVVYDQKNMLPMAEHDTENYTTFYNYDENYVLVRKRVETIEGIQTVSELETGSGRKQ